MKRVALIDLQEPEPKQEILHLHLFHTSAGSYEWEKSLGPSPLHPPAFYPPQLAKVKDFYLSLPLSWLNFRILELPFADPDRLREVIPFELEGIILPPTKEITFDVVVLERENGGCKVLVAYTEQDRLRDILERLAALSIDPRIITCLELRCSLQEAKEELPWRLLDFAPISLDPESRLEAGRQELVAPTINLRRGPLSFARDREKTKRGLRLMAVLSLSLALVVHLDLGFKIVQARRDIASLRTEMRSRYAALFPGEKNVTDEVYFLKSHLKEFQAQGEALKEVDLLQLLVDLSTRKVPGTVFSEIDVQESLLTLKGQADSMASLEKLIESLKEPLREISLSEMKPSAAGRISFTLIAKGRSV